MALQALHACDSHTVVARRLATAALLISSRLRGGGIDGIDGIDSDVVCESFSRAIVQRSVEFIHEHTDTHSHAQSRRANLSAFNCLPRMRAHIPCNKYTNQQHSSARKCSIIHSFNFHILTPHAVFVRMSNALHIHTHAHTLDESELDATARLRQHALHT